ncbi:MAG: OmpA family protein [Desulfobacterales bacterium]|nr:OmpA family protein [Desulfobacterales bacterium]
MDISESLIQDDDQAAWIVTYADLMTLLLVFFVLLYSLTSLDNYEFKLAAESIEVKIGDRKQVVTLLDILDAPERIDRQITIEDLTGLHSRNDEILKDIQKVIDRKDLGDYLSFTVLDSQIIIQIRGKVLFQSGYAILNPEAYSILDELIQVIKAYPEYDVNIKGHTDNLPISTQQYPSNWELSAIRATTVLKYFIQKKVSPKRLTATGYGDSLPLVPNDTEEHRVKNRRVEFVLEKKK